MKNIAIIGSSGGNLYNLGGKDPVKLLSEIKLQTDSTEIAISNILFIGADAPMDNIKPTAKASIFRLENGEIVSTEVKTLSEINEDAKKYDLELANIIESGNIDGLILMSCDPSNINKKSIDAAISKKIPIVGTGGASMADLQSNGANVIAVSGTTGTTNRTRAISAITSLSKYFNIKYRPVIGSSGSSSGVSTKENVFKRINFRGIMMGALPGFISMALILAVSKIPGLEKLTDVFDILIKALPVMVAVIAAKQVSGLDEVGIVAGVISGVLSVEGGIIGGIIGGILAGLFSYFIITKCFDLRVPATTANIIAGGLSGIIAGLLVYFLLAPVALFIGEGIKKLLETIISFSPILAGVVGGLLIWPAIIGGVYHAAILPIVLLEMEATGNSFLGSIDMVGLVMCSAGITFANIIAPRRKDDKSIAVPGFLINVCFGTFVEASYPFMFSNKLVFASAIVSSAIGGAVVGLFNVRGTAYVPAIIAPGLSTTPIGFVIAMLASFLVAFLLTVIVNKISKAQDK